jgi:hypothetical protein
LDSRSNGHILTKDIPVPSQDAISLFAKHTISHLHNVINIMQRVSKCPFHSNSFQYDGRILSTGKVLAKKILYRNSFPEKYYKQSLYNLGNSGTFLN